MPAQQSRERETQELRAWMAEGGEAVQLWRGGSGVRAGAGAGAGAEPGLRTASCEPHTKTRRHDDTKTRMTQ